MDLGIDEIIERTVLYQKEFADKPMFINPLYFYYTLALAHEAKGDKEKAAQLWGELIQKGEFRRLYPHYRQTALEHHKNLKENKENETNTL